jgi:hypothetical protein
VNRLQVAAGIATIVVAIVAGTISFDYVNRRYPATPADHPTTKSAAEQTDSAPVKPSGPCVAADGSWKNWPWPNVPMLSPKCDSAK